MRFACATLLICLALAAEDLARQRSALDREHNPQRLAAAGIAIANSNNPAAIADLARHFGTRSFLHRLDPQLDSISNLGDVFNALALHPSPAVESLCLSLASNREFASVPVRLNFLLAALAAVRPMDEAAAKLFRSTSRTEFLDSNGPLLATNASPQALAVLAELFRDDSLNLRRRVDIAHWGLLPNRTNPDVIAMCSSVLNLPRLNHEVEVAIIESLYDYQPRDWFSFRAGQPSAPPWAAAPPAARQALITLGPNCLRRPGLSPALRSAIEHTLAQLR